MTLRPEDKALAAYLIENDAIPFETLLRALNDAAVTYRDLGDSLERLGVLDARAVVGYRAEVAKREVRKDRAVTQTDREAPARAPSHHDDHDTWFDMPRPDLGDGTTPEDRAHFGPTPPPIIDESERELELALVKSVLDTKTVEPNPPGRGAQDWEGLGPTRPYGPGGRLNSDLLEQMTIVPGEGFDIALPRITTPSASGDPWEVDKHTRPPSFAGARNGPFGDTVLRAETSIEVDIPVNEEQRLAPSGKRTDERYLFRGEIGRGGMGRILKATDTEIGREVAVKVLLGGRDAPDNLIRRFWTEVQATGQLEHPAIIPIHDVGRLPSGELFYVMKKLSGRTLAEILTELREGDPAAQKEFQRVRLLTIFQQIAYAVAFAHARGVIHRDIKPANIMVGRYGESILIDWGLAKVIDEQGGPAGEELARVEMVGPFSGSETASGTITGTPQYMSPEATEGKPERVTTKSDVYGLGAVLYELLVMEPPFADLGFVPTVVKVRQGDFVPPRMRAPGLGIAVELEELCLRAMTREPTDRPMAKELADELGRILEGAKERERRLEEAKRRVRAGRRSTERWKMLKVELQSAEAEAKRLAKEVPAWAEISEKEPIWKVEDRVSELKIEAISAFEESEADFLRALGEVPDDREARSALASLYFARFGEAERARDFEGQRYYRSLVQRYDDGVWERVLEGDGSLEIFATPADVTVTIAPMELTGRVLRPAERTSLGRVPVRRFDLPIGSNLLTFSRAGERDIVRPVLIGRTESVTVHLPFRSSRQVGDDFVLVPEGPVILGGDPVAHGSLDRRVVDVDEFAIARFPVTCDEYLAFLNSLAQDDVEEALKHVPRARAQEGHYWRINPTTRRFEYPQKSPGGHAWVGNIPVNGVSMRDAESFIAWRSVRTGERLRLPHEDEWEKAARGVDGRFFPWGDHFDPTFCKMKESRNLPYPEPEPVGAFPIDCSPYGARDMAGSIRELCVTEQGGRELPVMRGGCWHDTGLFCRVAFRHVTQPDFVNTGLGFRLAKDITKVSY